MNRNPMTRRRMFVLTLLVLLTLLFIWENSLTSRADSSDRSRQAAQWLQENFEDVRGIGWLAGHVRKAAHFIEYAVLGILGALILQTAGVGRNGHYILHLLFFCLLAAVLDEALQMTTDRASRATDVLLDFSGALTGAGGCLILGTLFSLLGRKKK